MEVGYSKSEMRRYEAMGRAIRLWLEVTGETYQLAQVGNTFVIPKAPCDLPADTEAVLCISVDGRERKRAIRLPDGAREHQKARWVGI